MHPSHSLPFNLLLQITQYMESRLTSAENSPACLYAKLCYILSGLSRFSALAISNIRSVLLCAFISPPFFWKYSRLFILHFFFYIAYISYTFGICKCFFIKSFSPTILAKYLLSSLMLFHRNNCYSKYRTSCCAITHIYVLHSSKNSDKQKAPTPVPFAIELSIQIQIVPFTTRIISAMRRS